MAADTDGYDGRNAPVAATGNYHLSFWIIAVQDSFRRSVWDGLAAKW
jgi:hypothetical protein